VEISTPKGDIVVLGTDELPPKPWTPEAIVDFAKSIDGVSIVAHPFRAFGMGNELKIQSGCYRRQNGGSSPAANAQAKELAKSMGLPGTAGSDAHSVSELFNVHNNIEASLDVDSVLQAIRKGRVSAQVTHGLTP
jgi:hypothetical protein